RLGADLVVASDPDGDRLAVAWPTAPGAVATPAAPGAPRAPRAPDAPGAPSAPAAIADGTWRMLSGDQLGALVGAYPPETEGTRLASAGTQPLVATTIVSSTVLSKIAAAAGARYRETLTGFKWIARAGDELDTGGVADVQFVFGYEEALGYMVGQI